MTVRSERRIRLALWMGTGLFAVGTMSLAGIMLVRPSRVRPLPASGAVAPQIASINAPAEVEAFARKRMSCPISKPETPAPAKAAAPPLDTLVRLSGIIDYGPESPREAFLEVRSTGTTKGYRTGDAVADVGATVKAITDMVVMEYDGQLWKVSDRGVQLHSGEPALGTGTKP